MFFSLLFNMAAAVGDYSSGSNSLTVHNLPYSYSEAEIRSLFPSASSVNLLRSNKSKGVCVLQFNNSRDCENVYYECQGGMEVQGRALRAEYTSAGYDQGGNSDQYSGYGSSRGNDNRDRRDRSPQMSDDKIITISNLPYAMSERDIRREFPGAIRVTLSMNAQGRSRGVAQVFFGTMDECRSALSECNNKYMGGRPVRAKLGRDSDSGDYNSSMDYGRQSGHNNGNRYNDRNNRFQSHRGGDYGSGGGGGGGGGGRWQQRDQRRGGGGRSNDYGGGGRGRDRSPMQSDEPVRGYGHSKGPRITSAVVTQGGGSSDSDSSGSY